MQGVQQGLSVKAASEEEGQSAAGSTAFEVHNNAASKG